MFKKKTNNEKLKELLKEIVVQGNHEGIVDIYREIYLAVFNEFTEDNRPTMEGYMRDCVEEAISSMMWSSKTNVELVRLKKHEN